MKVIKRTKEDLIFDVIVYTVLSLLFVIVAYPLYFILIASISDPIAVSNGETLLYPARITLEGYQRILADNRIWSGYLNTIIYTIIGTCINVTITMMIAYPLSRKGFSGRNVIMVFLMITMYFSGGIIPQYLLVKSLGLINNWLVIVILGAVSVYNIIIARSFLEANIPDELLEAASIDGCSQLKFFFTMVIPLSKAIIAVLALYYGVAHWNDFMKALIYLKDESLHPLQLILRSILIQSQMSAEMSQNMSMDVELAAQIERTKELIKYGVIIISSLPVLIIYPFMQKYFVKGVMIGSIKG